MKFMHFNSFVRFTVGSIRFWLGVIFLTSGLAKLTHGNFPNTIGPPFLEEELAKYGLGMYARFIAFSQVTIGFLLVTKRFATLGAVMATPMLLNILMVVVALKWQGTPYVVGFLLLCNTILLVYDFHKLKFILTDNASLLTTPIPKRNNPKLDMINLFAFGILLLGAALWNTSETLATYVIDASLLAFIGLGLYASVLRQKRRNVSRLETTA